MQAVVLSRFGGPDVLDVVDIPRPAPRVGEVLIRVMAAGVNYFEVLMRAGRYGFTPQLPMTPGVEVAGVVEDIGGNGHAGTVVGSRVAVPLFAHGLGGGYAQFVTVDARAVHPIPDDVPFDAAVAAMVQGLTALHAVRRSPATGKTVLIPAAAGGVGALIVQLARRQGARRIIAAAGSDEKIAIARALGADAGVVTACDGWGAAVADAASGEGIDVVYDFVGGIAHEYLAALAPQGQVLFGALGRADLDHAALNAMFGQNQSLEGLALIPLLTAENVRTDLAELYALIGRGELTVRIAGRYALGEIARAHRMIEARKTTGKVVLLP
ncbi:quinone oxidoreductase family protein [Bradyrhizobium mercantei]|uniref:quinone oxidoreductase family protein n=1 Tax=Bradyrhizobium mercantei TaxID=1904807 RepID=UPI0009781687|nr:zinc-binding dehydrogenase [Bradyrhizobium mercantei]